MFSFAAVSIWLPSSTSSPKQQGPECSSKRLLCQSPNLLSSQIRRAKVLWELIFVFKFTASQFVLEVALGILTLARVRRALISTSLPRVPVWVFRDKRQHRSWPRSLCHLPLHLSSEAFPRMALRQRIMLQTRQGCSPCLHKGAGVVANVLGAAPRRILGHGGWGMVVWDWSLDSRKILAGVSILSFLPAAFISECLCLL